MQMSFRWCQWVVCKSCHVENMLTDVARTVLRIVLHVSCGTVRLLRAYNYTVNTPVQILIHTELRSAVLRMLAVDT
jgi:hypothetical protein